MADNRIRGNHRRAPHDGGPVADRAAVVNGDAMRAATLTGTTSTTGRSTATAGR